MRLAVAGSPSRSTKPALRPDHKPYSKSVMSLDMVRMMEAQGFSRFSVAGHDRGAGVAYRMALDQVSSRRLDRAARATPPAAIRRSAPVAAQPETPRSAFAWNHLACPLRYARTASACSDILRENECCPAPPGFATKKRKSVSAGESAAFNDSEPAFAIGPGGRPAWR